MIYPIIKKISNFQFPISNANQAGVTLLLAILILSSILAISFSLATVLFVEVRTSGDLVKTEPAIYAATGVGEQALFDLQRSACPSNGAGCYTTNFPNGVTMPATPTTVASSSPIFTDRVKTGSSLGGTINKYFFCSGSGTGGCGYGKAIVNYIPSNTGSDPLYAYMCEFDDTGHTSYPSAPCTATGTTQGYWKVPDNGFPQNADGSVTLTPSNSSVSWTITNSGLQQELILTNPAGGNDIFAQIQTFAPNGTTGQGLPYLGKTAINISILNSVVGRKIQVVAPNASTAAPGPSDTVWVEDSLPPGASPAADNGDSWNWVSSSPSPYSGSSASQSNIAAGEHQHYFTGASSPLVVNTGDTMVAYVYLDPANPPSEIMLQWNVSGDWSHRVYWGANSLCSVWFFSCSESVLNHNAGSLPGAGQWVRLTVPASSVGLDGATINGMAFTLYGGRATWDHTGKNP
jgi:hypothetical protein